MTSLLPFVKLLFNILCFLHDEPFSYHITANLNSPCARNVINVARARRRMHLSAARNTTTTTSTIHLICLLWLSWASQLVRSWAWGPYNDDWKRHIAPQNAANMYRVVLPRSNSTASTFFSTGNSTKIGSNGTATGTGTGTGTVPLSTWTPPTYTNTTNTSSTTKVDTTCGVSSPLYTLQISGADGYTFNEWWLKLSGNSVLFTSHKEKATSFGVNSDTKHLCIPRSSATQSRAGRLPLIAIVETRLDQGPLYFLDADRTANHEPDYEPIECDGLQDGGALSCSWDSASIWSGCGLQLELGAGDGTDGTLNCSSIRLNAFGT